MIHTGDCLEVMRTLPEASMDAVVTDPPYGLEFMGKAWDGPKLWGKMDKEWKDRPKGGTHPFANERPIYRAGTPFQAWCEAWGREALRVTVPGGYLLAFGGTRTHHRLVCGLEDAGWIIRDELDWIYASGFPKGKANLKPAHEPIVLARKPGPLRMLGIDDCRIPGTEAQKYTVKRLKPGATLNKTGGNWRPDEGVEYHGETKAGRWPANVILTDAVFDGGVDGVVGGGATESSPYVWPKDRQRNDPAGFGMPFDRDAMTGGYGDSGTYSRFFLIPKADRADREPVLRGQLAEQHAGVGIRAAEPGEYDEFVYPAPEGIGAWLKEQRIAAGHTRQTLAPLLPDHKNLASAAANVSNWEHEFNRPTPDQWRTLRQIIGFDDRYDEVMTTVQPVDRKLMEGVRARRENAHPTVKPLELMRHLVRLVVPSGGTCLDPFLGSGTTAIACEMEGFAWLGIEKEAEYVAIAEARLNGVQRGLGLDVPAPTRKRGPQDSLEKIRASGRQTHPANNPVSASKSPTLYQFGFSDEEPA